LLTLAGSTLWCHNVGYEWEYCKKLHISVDDFTWACSQILAHCVDKENKGAASSLDLLSQKYNQRYLKLSFEPSVPWENFSPSCADWEAMLEYNVRDVLSTKELIGQLLCSVGLSIKGQSPTKKAKYRLRMYAKLKHYFWNIRMPFFKTLVLARNYGLTMDAKAVESIISEIDSITNDFPKYPLPVVVKGKPHVHKYAKGFHLVEDKRNTPVLNTIVTAFLVKAGYFYTTNMRAFVKERKPWKTKVNTGYYMDAEGSIVASEPSLVWHFCPLDWSQLTSTVSKNVVWYFKERGYDRLVNDCGNIDKEKINANTNDPLEQMLYKGATLATIRNYMSSYIEHANFQFATKNFFTVHSRLDINGTQTGRLSSSSPNIQNISGSKSNENEDIQAIYKKIRSIVVARPGYTFVSADIDRAELMILGKILEPWDTGLRDTLNAGADIHAYNADKWKLERLNAKRVIFSLIYGATHVKIAEICKCSIPKGKKILKQVHDGMPALEKALAYYVKQCEVLGGVYDLFDDFKSYPDIHAEKEWQKSRVHRQLFNAVIQGTNASLMAWLCKQLTEVCERYSAFIVAIVHDEILLEVPSYRTAHILADLAELTTERYDVPGLEGCCFNAEWKQGISWAETK
jgi:hypothetical protein